MSALFQSALAGDISLIWAEPPTGTASGSGTAPRRLVIWLNGFGCEKEACQPQLSDLAAAGFVALSFDAFQHGERRVEATEGLVARILSNIRTHFWPILARTASDVSYVIDWAVENLGVEKRVGVGGVSMGGDIAIAAAGLDQRIICVATCNSTPDWLRPGSHEPPGAPDEIAQQHYDACNPLTHLHHYAHCPATSFQCGALDTQVPPDGAIRFVQALQREYACGERLEVVLHEGIRHEFTPVMWRNALNWFETNLTGGE